MKQSSRLPKWFVAECQLTAAGLNETLVHEGAAYVFVKPVASGWASTIQSAKLILVEAVAEAPDLRRTTTMGFDFSGKRVAVLGAGKMGGILLKALLEKGLLSPQSTRATVQHEESARGLADKLGIPVGTDNLAAVHKADIVFVC